MPAPRMTLPTQAVLRTLLAHPSHEFYGLELCAAAGLASGTIHPILARLETLGWLASRWEELDPHEAGRPRRRYYSLTSDGAVQANRALAQADARVAKLGFLRPGLAGGQP
ncbi:PadR family transcriptional regulator [Plantactinospora soyae]|uniref:DNA-binding MarR family transcriptional regulator n=1 Tax=Plantactinospora soyae TaxID=1544732 RepID=A0A927LZ90_9ACTN|nr:PadR family transcriptional regulator [Plantactinospora soyae]MBE1484654.1 DNA-binding MarR family transcriptional regulator [Plantactinospora soyae]